ncbi:hypothetical protein [Variovorax sp. LT1P1]|uniref:hypothetical protein n=1 Tax=Variovorax sp. LT1P1 TaxID=3443730 RepID=UPI003F4987BF
MPGGLLLAGTAFAQTAKIDKGDADLLQDIARANIAEIETGNRQVAGGPVVWEIEIINTGTDAATGVDVPTPSTTSSMPAQPTTASQRCLALQLFLLAASRHRVPRSTCRVVGGEVLIADLRGDPCSPRHRQAHR